MLLNILRPCISVGIWQETIINFSFHQFNPKWLLFFSRTLLSKKLCWEKSDGSKLILNYHNESHSWFIVIYFKHWYVLEINVVYADIHCLKNIFVVYYSLARPNYFYYWIYNLIRAVFFQNLNVYLRKACTIVLFKVLPIWNYDFFPSFWQFVDSIPKELCRLGGQEWIKPIFDTLFWCETYSSKGVLHRPEQMVVRRVGVKLSIHCFPNSS